MKKNSDNKEHFVVTNGAYGYSIYGILHFLAFLFAIYLSFKCNGRFDIGSFIVALICPWIYIVWILATRRGFCLDYNDGMPPFSD